MSEASSFRPKAEQLESREVPAASGIFATAEATGGVPRVQVIETATGRVISDFLAFEASFTGGVQTAFADVTNDGIPDLILGAGVGGGPRVRVVDGRAFRIGTPIPAAPINGQTIISGPAIISDFFAFESTQRGGVTVSSGNFAGGSFDDLVIGAGPGGGPRVRILDGQAVSTQRALFNSFQTGDTIADFFAFESTFRNGVNVAATPILGFAFSDLVVTPGLGGGPRVIVFSGSNITLRRQTFVGNQFGDVIANFFAGDPSLRTGLTVAAADFNRDGSVDIAVGSGLGGTPGVIIYSGQAIRLQPVFTGQLPGDVLDSFPVNNSGPRFTQPVNVGYTIDPTNPTGGLLIIGAGGDGRIGQSQVIRFQPGAGFVTRQSILSLTFDPNFIGGIFVSG